MANQVEDGLGGERNFDPDFVNVDLHSPKDGCSSRVLIPVAFFQLVDQVEALEWMGGQIDKIPRSEEDCF